MTEITDMVNRLQLDLMAARKTGEVVAYAVRYGSDYEAGVALHALLVERLHERGVTVKIDTARNAEAVVFLMEDTTPVGAAA
jgi:hypothetical protein